MANLIMSGGRILGIAGAICETGSPPSPPAALANAPRAATAAAGGDQSYGQATTSGFTSYSAAGPGTDAYTAVQALGRNDILFGIGGSYEGWPDGGVRSFSDLTDALKSKGSFPNTINASRGCFVFRYCIMESSQNASSGLPYQAFASLVIANNWWTYSTAGGTGTKVTGAGGSTFFEVNYSYAWNTSAGSAGLDQSITGHVYGTLSNGMGCAQTAATYFSSLLTTNPQDSRFLSLTNGPAPNADGLFLDNCFIFPNGGGNLSTTGASWDGINVQTNATIAAYPSGASSLLSRGQDQFFQQMQSYLSTCNPGSTYLNIGNFGNYWNNIGYGDIATETANATMGTFHGGLVETAFGVPGSGYQNFQTFADMLQNYHYIMDNTTAVDPRTGVAPKLVGLGMRLPATDGSTTATWTINGTATTVTTGTSQEYQCARAGICFTLLDDGFPCIFIAGGIYGLVRWYDELGDDSLTQVNVKRGWLGTRVGTRPTAATLPNGLWGVRWQNGVSIFNPWGNGSQTLTLAQLQAVYPGTYNFLEGTQNHTVNSGAAFSSFTFGDPDGLVLVNAGAVAITNVNPLVPNGVVGTAYTKQMNATGGVPPYTWSMVSASPNTGGQVVFGSTGQFNFTPSTAETETLVIQVTDSVSNSAQDTYTLNITT